MDNSVSPLIDLFSIFPENYYCPYLLKNLLDQLRDQIQVKRHSSRTEEAYTYWCVNLSSSTRQNQVLSVTQLTWGYLNSIHS